MEFESVAIAWLILSYRIRPYLFGKEKTILNKLNGFIRFGTINALMGPSGSGKSTLLECLSGKISYGLDKSTKIFVNKYIKINSCFIGQRERDHLIMCLTAKQNLIYASKLKNSDYRGDSPLDHELIVKKIMDELLISDISDTRVDFCSGGQQKRLTIAVEMTQIVKPNLLFIDEPTTGLDSNSAKMVICCLKRVAKSYKVAILTSIHQPTQEIVRLYDNLYILSKNGSCIFNDEPGEIAQSLIENGMNDDNTQLNIHRMLKVASMTNQNEMITKMIDVNKEHFKEFFTDGFEKHLKLIPKGLEIQNKRFRVLDIWYIIERSIQQNFICEFQSLLFQLLFYILMVFLSKSVFNENIGKLDACISKTNNSTYCQDNLNDIMIIFQNENFMGFSILFSLFIHACVAAKNYIIENKIFVHEHRNKWYSTGSHFIAKLIINIIPMSIFSITFSFLLYYISGQLFEANRVYLFILTFYLGYLCVEGLVQNISIILSNNDILVVMVSLLTMTLMFIICNFYLPIKELLRIFQYMSELSFTKFIFNNAMIIIYGLNRCKSNQKSMILANYSITDQDLSSNLIKLTIYAIGLKLSVLILQLSIANINKLTNILNIFKSSCPITLTDEHIDQINSSYTIELSDDDPVENCENRQGNSICIAWTDLTLVIPKNIFNSERKIFKEMNGFFEFGTLNALMGSSGSGKTTLLKCLNGVYNKYLTSETKIFLTTKYKIKSCYINQDEREHLLNGLTVRQAMTYASKLKNLDNNFDHKTNIWNILTELLITNTVDTNVEKCSGGEQKRLVIAMEMTASIKPNLICIDEPTSGLDSFAAETVIKVLSRLSKRHNTCIITSIHQPNSDTLSLFDSLYVLAKSGDCLYCGRPQDLKQHLANNCIQFTETQLAIEILLKYSDLIKDDRFIQSLCMIKETKINLAQYDLEKDTQLALEGINIKSKRFYLRDINLLILRNMNYTFAYLWKFYLIQFLIYISFALFLKHSFSSDIVKPSSCLRIGDFSDSGCKQSEDKVLENRLIIQNIRYNFTAILISLQLNFFTTLLSFTQNLKIFFNEQRNGWYSTGAYYWSKVLIEWIPTIIMIACYSYIIDIYSEQRSMFLTYLIYFSIGSLLVQALAHLISIVFSDNQNLAIFMAVAISNFQIIMSNFVIPIKELHYSLQTISKLSPFRLINECFLLSYYGFGRCSPKEFSYILNVYNIKDQNYYQNTKLLIILFLIYSLLALIALLIKVNFNSNNRKLAIEKAQIVESLRQNYSKSFIPGLTSEYIIKN